MYLAKKPHHGFTVIELLITVAVLATLSALGIPTMNNAINNAKVRSTAEALQNGLRTAQAEAIRRSRQTAFVLTNDTPAEGAAPSDDGTYWYVQVLPAVPGEVVIDPYVQGGQFGARTAGTTIRGPAVICFNSIGRAVANNATGLPGAASCAAPASRTTFDVTKTGADRTLRLQVSAAGKIRMCDTARLLSAAPDGC
ncbi:MAG: GspH/FimT family pseudopilin [Pseudomonadota bacterium]